MSFLKAEWKKLVLANYAFDEVLLTKYLPYKTELDKWNGTTYVSLVGFMFKNTRLLGVKIPFHTDFEEVNLRFYVRYKEDNEWKRGVVFIKEIVPKVALTLVANTIYKEHYETMKMNHRWDVQGKEQIVEYEWIKNGQAQKISVTAETEPGKIQAKSEEEFITEHYWGYTRINERKTYEYEVTHPKWESYKINAFAINVDFGSVYGPDFKVLTEEKPKSVMLMEGSEITVENKRAIG